jgi:hypothetical protein
MEFVMSRHGAILSRSNSLFFDQLSLQHPSYSLFYRGWNRRRGWGCRIKRLSLTLDMPFRSNQHRRKATLCESNGNLWSLRFTSGPQPGQTAEPEASISLAPTSTTGHDPEPVPSTSHPHKLPRSIPHTWPSHFLSCVSRRCQQVSAGRWTGNDPIESVLVWS